MPKNILLTGGAGYIGSVLTGYLLNAGYNVICVDSLKYRNHSALLPYLGHPNYKFFQEDVTNYREWWKYLSWKTDVVIPLAALVGMPLCEKNKAEATLVNFEAIDGLVKQLSKKQHIIYFNTNSGYGQTNVNIWCTEQDKLTPISVYGKTKCDAENSVLQHDNSTVFRLATVFGTSPRMRMDLLVNDFTEKLYHLKYSYRDGETFKIFEPTYCRNFVHVRDVSRAVLYVLQSLESEKPIDGVYNLGLQHANLTKWQLATKICEILNLPLEVLEVAEGKDPDQRNYLVDNSKILSTGFKFEFDLSHGVQEVLSMLDTDINTEKMRNV